MTNADFLRTPALGFLVVFGLDRLFFNGVGLQVIVDGVLHEDHVRHRGDFLLDGVLLVDALLLGITSHDLVFDDHLLHLILKFGIHHHAVGIRVVGKRVGRDLFLLSLGDEFAVHREVLEFGHGGAGGESKGERGGNRGLDHFLILLWG